MSTNCIQQNPLPRISIVIPNYNHGSSLECAINSVINQNYSNIELIVVDGASKDNSVDIIKKFENTITAWVSEPDHGLYDAMNKGLNMATGEWIYFLGADDILCHGILKNIFSDFPDVDFIYGNVFWGNSESLYDGEFSQLKLFEHNICHQAIFVRKKILLNVGGFNDEYKVCADYCFNLYCFLNKNLKIKYLNMPIAKFSTQGISSREKDTLFFRDKLNLITKFGNYSVFNSKIRNVLKEGAIFHLEHAVFLRGIFLTFIYSIVTRNFFYGMYLILATGKHRLICKLKHGIKHNHC